MADGGPLTPASSPNITGGVFRGADTNPGPYKWRCPTCNNEWTSPLEEGCPRCKEQAAPGKAHQDLPEAALISLVLRNPASPVARQSVRAAGLSLKARRSVMRALAFYSEGGALHADELTRQEVLSWARLLNDADAHEEALRQEQIRRDKATDKKDTQV